MLTEDMAAPGAARRLLEYIRANARTIPAFAERHGIDRYKLQNVVRGKVKRIDVDFALDIERATAGEIPFSAWRSTDVASH